MLRIFFVLVCLTSSATAERRVLEPWEQEDYAAVGRISSPYPGGSGTGTLIAHDTVLTAAHLFFDDGVLRGAPERFAFSVGASLAERCAVRSVHRLAAIDAALLRVNCEGKFAAPAWRCGAPQASGVALLVGFHADVAAGTARRIERCRYRRLPTALLLASCDARALASGAPLFVLDGSQPLLAAVVRGVGMPADALGMPDWQRRYVVASTLPADGLQLPCTGTGPRHAGTAGSDHLPRAPAGAVARRRADRHSVGEPLRAAHGYPEYR